MALRAVRSMLEAPCMGELKYVRMDVVSLASFCIDCAFDGFFELTDC